MSRFDQTDFKASPEKFYQDKIAEFSQQKENEFQARIKDADAKAEVKLTLEKKANFERVWDALQVVDNKIAQTNVVKANETQTTSSGIKSGYILAVILALIVGGYMVLKKKTK